MVAFFSKLLKLDEREREIVEEIAEEVDRTAVQNGGGVEVIVSLSQSEYDALVTPDPTTLYIIKEP